MDLNNISIQSVRINYIYSFFLGTYQKDSDKKESKVILSWDTATKDDKKTLKDLFRSELYKKDELEKNGINIIHDLHESEEHEPLSNRSALYFKFPHLSIVKQYSDNVKIQDLFNKEREGKLSIHIALFETGMGLMWVSIQVDKNLKYDEINLLNQRRKVPKIVSIEEDIHTLQDYYESEIENLSFRLNNIMKEHSFDYEFRSESDCFWRDNNNDYTRGKGIFQEPSIAILLKIEDYSTHLENLEFQHYISSILHGTDIKSLDKQHAKEHLGEYCTNLYPEAEFFTKVHGNCLLVLHNEVYENNAVRMRDYNQFKEFTYGLFRTYCAVRGTWYVYNLLSEEIDNKLKKLNEEIDNHIYLIDKAQQTLNNIILKSHFLQFLNSEDPFVRGIGLTKFAKLHEEVLKIYKPEEIKDNIKYKLSEYDKLIDAINSYKYYKNTEWKGRNNKIRIRSFAIPAIITMILIVLYFINSQFHNENIELIFRFLIFIGCGILLIWSFLYIYKKFI